MNGVHYALFIVAMLLTFVVIPYARSRDEEQAPASSPRWPRGWHGWSWSEEWTWIEQGEA